MKSFLVPAIGWPTLRKAALFALAGALIAGGFGIVHDQITYTISPEYFTRMKFDQFHGADFGLPPRVFVAEIGFLATWWVGLIAAWFLARIALAKFTSPGRRVMNAMAWMVGITVAAGIAGCLVGPGVMQNDFAWRHALKAMQVSDPLAFNRVAGIHLGSYIGALAGWIAMMARFVRSA